MESEAPSVLRACTIQDDTFPTFLPRLELRLTVLGLRLWVGLVSSIPRPSVHQPFLPTIKSC